jgi:putative glycosyltransferase (TIGR04348 family)
MARITIVTPAAAGARNGNRRTAARWAAMLRKAGHHVTVRLAWNGEACDLLIALHARRSHDSATRYRTRCPQAPLIVVLTGTDLYRDLPASAQARRSLDIADRVVVLQDHALRELPSPIRKKARVVYQSTDCELSRAVPSGRFRVLVLGHLRREKDPLRAAAAIALLPERTELELIQIGGALEPALGRQAKQIGRRDRRYRWLGSQPHRRALRWMASSHLLVVSSVMEGGANVIAEAARIGTPVLASRVAGNVGMLGTRYPGYFALHDERGLAQAIEKSLQAGFYRRLKAALRLRRPLFAPAAERNALLRLVAQALRLSHPRPRSSSASRQHPAGRASGRRFPRSRT